MAFNFFNNTIANSLSKTNNEINKNQGASNASISNPNKPIDGLINNINSKNAGNKGNSAIGIGGDDNQVMGETPWWNWEFGEGEMGGLPGGQIYDPNTLPPDYGGGNTGSEWPGDSLEVWQQLQQDMIGSGYIDDIYNFDWTEFQQFVQQLAQQGSTTIYDDVWSMFMDSYGPQDSFADDLIGSENDYVSPDEPFSSSLKRKQRARNLYYGGTGGAASTGFSTSRTIGEEGEI